MKDLLKTAQELLKHVKENPEAAKSLKKDDMPHQPGTPEDAAHDVVEEHKLLADEIAKLSPEQRKQLLEHLKTLKDQSQQRSPQNEMAGMSPQEQQAAQQQPLQMSAKEVIKEDLKKSWEPKFCKKDAELEKAKIDNILTSDENEKRDIRANRNTPNKNKARVLIKPIIEAHRSLPSSPAKDKLKDAAVASINRNRFVSTKVKNKIKLPE